MIGIRAWELVFNRLSSAGFIVFVCTLIYWSFIEAPPLTGITAHSDQTEIIAGRYLIVDLRGTKSRSCYVTSTHTLLDSAGILWSLPGPIAGWNSRHGTLAVTYKLKIPIDVNSGPAVYKEVITYFCNPIRSHVVTTPPININIMSAIKGY